MSKFSRIALSSVFSALVSLSAAQAPRSLKNEVMYQIMPIAFRSGSGTIFGDFKGMQDAIPYLKGLGVTAMWMTPIHPSPAYHGYQYSDGAAVNPRFGTEGDFRTFVHVAHQNGLRIYIDFVAYGIGGASPYASAPFAGYSPFSYPTWNGDTVSFSWWNMNDPSPAQIETNWALYWLNPNFATYTDAGVDGFRCDHAVDTYDAYGPNGLGYTTAQFWTPFKAAIKAQYPKAQIFAEQGEWALFGNTYQPPFDATFTKPLEFAVRDSLKQEDKGRFVSTMAGTLASTGGGAYYLATFGDHDVDRLISSVGDSIDRAKLAAGILMAQPFAPIIYSGDEIGMKGLHIHQYFSDSNDICSREPFKWNAVAGAPMSNYVSLNATVLADSFSHDNDGRSVQEQYGKKDSLLETYRRLIQIRKQFSPLNQGTYQDIPNDRASVISFKRQLNNSAVIPVFNLSHNPVTVNLDLTGLGLGNRAVIDYLADYRSNHLPTILGNSYSVQLPAYGMRYLVLGNPAPVAN